MSSTSPINDQLTQATLLKLTLAGVLYIANLADYITTKKALDRGLTEGNPMAKFIMKMGWRKYQALKFILPGTLVATGMRSDEPSVIWYASMGIMASVFIFAAVNNIIRMSFK